MKSQERSKMVQKIEKPRRKRLSRRLPTIVKVEESAGDPWLAMVPSGIMILPGSSRPVFLLKHEASGETLPVWMHPLDASVGLHELGQGTNGSPHVMTRLILGHLAVTQVDCYLQERIGHHQYARIVFKGEGMRWDGTGIRVRADEAMSFCLAHKARFYSTKSFISQCRVLNEELEKLQEGLLTGAATDAFPELEIDSKKPGYMM